MFGCFLGVIVTCLLLVIIGQLRGLKKALLATAHSSASAQTPMVAAGEMNAEAWLMELESKGAELLARIEGERTAVDVLAAQMAVGQSYLPKHAPEVRGRAPAPISVDNNDATVEVQEWVRPAYSLASAAGTGARGGKWSKDWRSLQQAAREMASGGAPPAVIASSLGIGREEVKLMLRLADRNVYKKSH